jgi:hypothetical protein
MKLRKRFKSDPASSNTKKNNDCNLKMENLKTNESFITANSSEVGDKKQKINELNHFQKINIFHRQTPKKGFMDIWWLYDDGGLSILIPYLISQRKHWHECKLRIFIQAKKSGNDVALEERK